MGAEDLAEGGVEHVGCGVVACGVLAAQGVNVGFDCFAEAHNAVRYLAEVHDDVGHDCLSVVDFDCAVGCCERAGVSYLAAALGVEGGLHENDFDALAGGCLADYFIVGDEADYGR